MSTPLAPALALAAACHGVPEGPSPATAALADTDRAACEPLAETCNGLDDDCDGAIDLPVPPDAPSWYSDADDDGYGTSASVIVACAAPDGYAAVADDCDDTRPGVFPGAPDPDPTCGDDVGDCDTDAPCGYAGVYDLMNADAVVVGEDEDVGGTVGGVGDVDGDGLGEVVTGPYVYAWDAAGERPVDSWKARVQGVDWRVGATLVGPASDFDGDGVMDLLFSRWAEPDTERSYELWLISGPVAGAIDPSTRGVRLDAGSLMDLGGPLDQRRAISMIGDVDGDGFGDAAASCASRERVGDEAVCVLPGSSGASDRSRDAVLWDDPTTPSRPVVAGIGDTDGDGLPDFAIGTKSADHSADNAGAVRVFAHLPSGDGALSDADALLSGENEYELAGFDLDGAGDVNGDGYADIIVGNVTYRENLEQEQPEQLVGATLALGPFADGSLGDGEARFVVEHGWQGTNGVTVRGIGDLDGDGRDGFALGSYRYGGWDWHGSVLVFDCSPSGVVPMDARDAEFRGVERVVNLGPSFDGLGDVDGDGRPDLAFGDPLYADGAGGLFLVTGHGW